MLTVGICKNLSDVKMMDQEKSPPGQNLFYINQDFWEWVNLGISKWKILFNSSARFGNDTKFNEGKHAKFKRESTKSFDRERERWGEKEMIIW